MLLDLVIKDFKAAITNVLRELNETMFKELKESVITMTRRIENINKRWEWLKKKKKPSRKIGQCRPLKVKNRKKKIIKMSKASETYETP